MVYRLLMILKCSRESHTLEGGDTAIGSVTVSSRTGMYILPYIRNIGLSRFLKENTIESREFPDWTEILRGPWNDGL